MRVGPVAVGTKQDVGRGRLSSLLRPLVPGLESEVLPLLQSEVYVILESQFVSSICSDLIVSSEDKNKQVKYYTARWALVQTVRWWKYVE